MAEQVELRLGVKTDPIEYRYSHRWLFQLLAQEGVKWVQLGTHFELYQLPDKFFHQLRREADEAGVVIDSLFTAHRELGGFFRSEPGYEQVARRNFERYIEIGGLLGARSVGSNPGAVLRDELETKDAGVACYLRHVKELMHHARQQGVQWLTIEPMSCLAEPPTLPAEIAEMGRELTSYHEANPHSTARVGFCTDIAHGYADSAGKILYNHVDLFEATVPWLYEVHLKNTDPQYNSTFGFTRSEREKGIIDVGQFRDLLLEHSAELPVKTMTGYLEIGGPKLGRDYSDFRLEESLRDSLRYLKKAFLGEEDELDRGRLDRRSPSETLVSSVKPAAVSTDVVQIAPSMMCADPLNFERDLRRIEAVGVDMLHMDIMDGHFVPNMPLGLAVLERLAQQTDLLLDVHLMVEDNDFFIELLSKIGVSRISVHVESAKHLDRTLARIRALGCEAGAALNPATPLSAIEYVLERLDYVLLMTVNPGYAGQQMTPASIRKIAACKAWLRERKHDLPVQVDGNVSLDNIPGMVAAGADNLVAGTSSLFHPGNSYADNKRFMLAAIKQGLSQRRSASREHKAAGVGE